MDYIKIFMCSLFTLLVSNIITVNLTTTTELSRPATCIPCPLYSLLLFCSCCVVHQLDHNQGVTHGVAKGAALHSVRVLNCQGTGSILMIALGLYHVTEQVKQCRSTRAVVNMSLTTKTGLYSWAMRDAITADIDSGIMVVAAAGNYQSDTCKYK